MSRSEQDIFDDLSNLAQSPGYAHAIASICFRDSVIRYEGEITPDDVWQLYSDERLIRTEISTLIGLMVKSPLDLSLPSPDVIQHYIDTSELLLNELHQALSAEWLDGIESPQDNPFVKAKNLREPIFYGGESAYSFQYRELAVKKYALDAAWLLQNRNLDVSKFSVLVKKFGSFMDERHLSHLKSLRQIAPDAWTMLPSYRFSAHEFSEYSGLALSDVSSFFKNFSFLKEWKNQTFLSLQDYNATNAYPFLQVEEDEYLLFQHYSLVEALYETPFYWMTQDKAYSSIALKNRGNFTEAFSKEALLRVFDDGEVYRNIRIQKNKTTDIGEIDCLVIYGDYAILVQAKSKKLTVEARKGNDLQLKDDFKRAVQDSYDQALICAEELLNGSCKLLDSENCEVKINTQLKNIYPLCIVSDHYPALSFQVRQFIEPHAKPGISPPLITDVFALDAMTEMLPSPLYFLSYLSHRARFSDKLMSGHEHTLLSYHLKLNLWVDPTQNLMLLHDDISTDLDIAMTVRREGIPGKATPNGILTRFENSIFSRLLEELEGKKTAYSVALGLMLLELHEDTINQINNGIQTLQTLTKNDLMHHDLTIGIGGASSGLTIHCNYYDELAARDRLLTHCRGRKYKQKANEWFGLAIYPEQLTRFVLHLDEPWRWNNELEQQTAHLIKSSSNNLRPELGVKKIRSTAACPCGSGRKYKNCCMTK